MTKALQKKLLHNALSELSNYYGNEGCNDLFDGTGILEGVTPKEKAEIEKQWIKLFPREAKECDNEIISDLQVVVVLKKLI